MSKDTIFLTAGEYLMREGDESHEMYYLANGTMAVFKRKGDAEQQIGTIYAGELIGEMSFLDEMPRSASVKSVGDCELTVIPRDKMKKFLSGQPNWYRALVQTLIDRLRRANQRVRV
jgi:CRP/FNR family cyclic AMP-dependent transcriptional regulator